MSAEAKAHHLGSPFSRHEVERRRERENRVADAITDFAGSMRFVYVHVVWFTLWIALGVEDYPFGLLTMIVSLEAIFLSTFILISQNRADARRKLFFDHQWEFVQKEEEQNEQLLDLSNQILELTRAIDRMASSNRQDRRDGAADDAT